MHHILTEKITILEKEIEKAEQRLFELDSEIKAIKADVNFFLQKYFSETMDVFKAEAAIQQEELNLNSDPVLQHFINSTKVGKGQKTEALKKKFREIALKCHPDKITDSSQHEFLSKIFTQLIEAYESSDLAKMLQIEDSIRHTKNIESLEENLWRLEKELTSLREQEKSILDHKNIIVNSASYKLHHQFLLHKVQGIDLIQKIKEKIKLES